MASLNKPDRSDSAKAKRSEEVRSKEKNEGTLLQARMEELGIVAGEQITTCTDLTPTTKILVTALLHCKPDTPLPSPPLVASTGKEYNQMRRDNEAAICEQARKEIPKHILEQDFMSERLSNPVTKILIAARKYLDEFEAARGGSEGQTLATSSPAPPLVPEVEEDASEEMEDATYRPRRGQTSSSKPVRPPTRTSTAHRDIPALTRKNTVPDSDDEDAEFLQSALPRDLSLEKDLPTTIQKPPQKGTFADVDEFQNLQILSQPRTSKTKRSKSPEKNNDTTRPWEQQKIEEHPVEEIRLLEQVAKRLVAKAKMMVEPPEETTKKGYAATRDDLIPEQLKDIGWVHDLMIDAISVIEAKEGKKKAMNKWTAEQARWAEQYDIQ